MIMSVPVFAQELPEDPSFRERKAAEGYTLDLKDLINKSKKRISQVEDKLKEQAKMRRNDQREAKAREYYEKAQRLFDQEKYEAATELWEKAIRITEHEEMEGYVNKSVRRQRRKEKALKKEENRRVKRLEQERGYTAKEVDKKYREAVGLYNDKSYLAAKVVFEEVDNMFPDHRATKSYIALIDRKIDLEQKDMIETKLKDPSFSSAKAKARWKKELQEKENNRQKKIREQADELYKEAVRLYKEKRYEKAKEKFKEVEWILPSYKRTIKYLSRIDSDIEKYGVTFTEEDKLRYFKKQVRENKLTPADQAKMQRVSYAEARGFTEDQRKREEAEFVYDAAETLYKKKYYEQALEKFYEVESIYPDYKKTSRFIKKLHKKLPDAEKKFEVVQQRSNPNYDELYKAPQGTNAAAQKAISDHQRGTIDQAEEKYQQAVLFYNKKNFVEAQRKFIAVEAIVPGYKATREHLKRIDADIASGQPSMPSQKQDQSSDTAKKSSDKRLFSFFKSDQKSDSNKQKEKTDSDYKAKYQMAQRLYKDRNYQRAKEVFLEVNDLKPGYRSTLKYISKSNQKLEKIQSAREELHHGTAVAQDGTLSTETGLGVDAYERFKRAAHAGEDYVPIIQDTVSPRMMEQITKKKMEGQDYVAPAVTSTEKIKHVLNTKMVGAEDSAAEQEELRMIAEAQAHIDRAKQAEIQPVNNFAGIDTNPTDPNYVHKLDHISRKEQVELAQQQRQIKHHVIEDNRDTMKKMGYVIGDTYKDAIDLYREKKYVAARAKFATVERLHPGYRRAESYIKRIDHKVASMRNPSMEKSYRKLRREEERLKKEARARAKAAAKLNEQVKDKKSPLSEMAYAEQLEKEFAQEAHETDAARKARLQRIEEERLAELEERVDFQRDLARKEKRMLADKKKEMRERKRRAKAEKRAEERQRKMLKAEREQRHQKNVRHLSVIKGEILRLLKANDGIEAQKLMMTYEETLAKCDYTEAERTKLRAEFRKEQQKVQHGLDHRRQHTEAIVQDKYDQELEAERKLKAKRQKELEELEARIRKEERKLERSRRKEYERLARARQKRSRRGEDVPVYIPPTESTELPSIPEVVTPAPKLPKIKDVIMPQRRAVKLVDDTPPLKLGSKIHKNPLTPREKKYIEQIRMEQRKKTPREYKVVEDKKEEEISQLVRNRQLELKKKRQGVQRKYDQNIKKLYKKAIKLYKKEQMVEATILFNEIQRMQPNYKRTSRYLSKLQNYSKSPQVVVVPTKTSSNQPSSSSKPSRADVVTNALDAFEQKM